MVASLMLAAMSLLAQNPQSNPGSGTFTGRQYISTYFGFTYSLPEGWSGTVAESNATGPAFRLFSASPPSTGETDLRRIVVQAEYLGHNTGIKTGKDFLDRAVPLMTGPASTFESLSGDTHYTLGGQGFDRMDLRSKQAPGRPVIYTAQVCTVLGDYVLTFQLIGTSHEDLEGLMRSMGPLRFAATAQASTSPGTGVAAETAAKPSNKGAAAPSTLIGTAPAERAPAAEKMATPAPLNDSPTQAQPNSDATKAAMMPGVIPAPSASMSPATGTPTSAAGAGKTIQVAKTTETHMQLPAATLESYVIKKVPAMYPPAALQAHIEGVVVLTIVVNEKGNVQEVKAISGATVLARSAEESLRQWRFKPILVDGKPAQIESQVSLNFQIPRR